MILLFLRQHWKVLAIMAIFSVLYVRGVYYKHEMVKAKNELSAIKLQSDLIQQQNKQAIEHAKKKAQTDLAKNTAQHVSDINLIANKYYGMVKDEKSKHQIDVNSYRNQLANRLQTESHSYQNRVSENDTNQPTSKNSDTAIVGQCQVNEQYIKTLEQAGAVCASDYNYCYEYVKSQQSIIGVYD